MSQNEFNDIHENHIVDDYLQFSVGDRAFIQKFLFLDYLEVWNIEQWSRLRGTSLKDKIEADMYLHVQAERYETAQLYRDVLERYKKDIQQFG